MFRLLSNRFVKYGQYFFQNCCKRDIHIKILEHRKRQRIPANVQKAGGENHVRIRYNAEVFRFRHHARRLVANNLLNRVTIPYSAEFKNQAAKEILYGYSTPGFALVGATLGSGASLLSKEDELEASCVEIREAALSLQNKWTVNTSVQKTACEFNLDDIEIGPPLAKGCTAVVYAAALKNNETVQEPELAQEEYDHRNTLNKHHTLIDVRSNVTEILSMIRSFSRFVYNFGGISSPFDRFVDGKLDQVQVKVLQNVRPYSMELDESYSNQQQTKAWNTSIDRYPLALKMMFNYDIQSNALSILRAMRREIVPAQHLIKCGIIQQWEDISHDEILELPPHPNVVFMFGVFCAQIPDLHGAQSLYPMALPPRLNPDGYGRNMSLFLLMKRYDCSLREYLDSKHISPRMRLLLFAQLLEAVAHLSRHGIAHRDLKSDNILIEICDQNSAPILVISDFGCCLADKNYGLQVPYTTHDTDKGGNTALMAPEIVNKVPGPFSVLNYTKSDLWACGAIAYEIFGHQNPFYAIDKGNNSKNTEVKCLKNINYNQTDLPELNINCPPIVKKLIINILNPDPNKRLSSHVAANVMQLFLWAPSFWLKSGGMPSNSEILQWLLSLTTKVICEGNLGTLGYNTTKHEMEQRTNTEFVLISSFLARTNLRGVKGALSWLQNAM